MAGARPPLQDPVAPAAGLPLIAGTVAETLQLQHVAVSNTAVGSLPSGVVPARLPLTYQGGEVGVLTMWPRPRCGWTRPIRRPCCRRDRGGRLADRGRGGHPRVPARAAAAAVVRLGVAGDRLVVEVADDGCGTSGVRDGVGPASMRERAGEPGGTLSRDSGPAGTRIRAELPATGPGPDSEPAREGDLWRSSVR